MPLSYEEIQKRIAREITHMMAEFDINLIDVCHGQHNIYYETSDGRAVVAEKKKRDDGI